MRKHCINNCEHNLVHHFARVLDDLWRYDQYVKDASKNGHKDCAALWKKISAMDAKQAEMLRRALENAVKAGKLK